MCGDQKGCVVNKRSPWAAAILACSMLIVSRSAWAEPRACARSITKENFVSCALVASLDVRVEEQGREVLEGRKTAVSPEASA